MAKKSSQSKLFENLAWDDLQEWAEAAIVTRGRRYQQSRLVQDLSCTPDEGLVAWVQGSPRYATQVEIDGTGQLASRCSCPYWTTCKHAVAVVLEYLECVQSEKDILTVSGRDRRLCLLQKIHKEEQDAGHWDEGDEADWDEEGGDEEGWEDEDQKDRQEDEAEGDMEDPVRSSQVSKLKTGDPVVSFLEAHTQEQLVTLLKGLAERHPDVYQTLNDQRLMSTGTASELVDAAREEIDELSQEPGWSNHWTGESAIPNYTRVRESFKKLLAQGYADQVLELCEELLEAGTQQVEMSDDEGETAQEIASCLDLVFQALPQSSRSPVEQMVWAIEAALDDDYDLCRGTEFFWEQEHAAEDWNSVAEQLARRLQRYEPEQDQADFSLDFRRDCLSNWLIAALEHAGRHAEIIPLCQQEAEQTGSYVRLIHHLKQAERWQEAEQWIHTGIRATKAQWPGIANELRTAFREIREQERNWPCVAAFYAEDFVQHPALHTFQMLQTAAEQAGVGPAVRAAALHYLKTGELPSAIKRKRKKHNIPRWPLPETRVEGIADYGRQPAPMLETLIDLAIAEKQPAEIPCWYDQRKPMGGEGGRYLWGNDDRIAEAIVETYPERAIAIWKQTAQAHIALTNVKAYETAAAYLRKVQRVLKRHKREPEWKTYLAELRHSHTPEPALVGNS